MAERRPRDRDSPRRRKRESQTSATQDALPRTRAPYNPNPTELAGSYSSSSSSYIDISRTYPPQRPKGLAGILAFFTTPAEHHRRPRRTRSRRALRMSNSSTSSINSDLAYGTGFVRRRKGDKAQGKRRERDGGLGRDPRAAADPDAEILRIGAELAEVARRQNRVDLRDRKRHGGLPITREDSGRVSGLESSRGLGSSRISHGPDEEGWESASDADSETSSVDSQLAYGGHTAGAGWGFNPPKPKRKESVVDPKLFGPQNSLLGVINEPVGFHDHLIDHSDLSDFSPPTAAELQKAASAAQSAASAAGSMKYVYPEPTSDPTRFDVGPGSVGTGQESYRTRPDPVPIQTAQVPIQQPQPIVPVSQSVYNPSYTARSEPTIPKTSGRTKTSLAGAALAGVTGAAIGASIMSDRQGERKDRPREERDRYDEDHGEGSRRGDDRDADDRRRDRRPDETEEERERRRQQRREQRRNETEEEREKRRARRREERENPENDPEKRSGGRRDMESNDDRRDIHREEKYSEPSDGRRDDKYWDDKYKERREDRYDDGLTKGSYVKVPPIDPFQFQVPDDAFQTPDGTRNSEPITGIQRARSPAIITVERVPHWHREESSSTVEKTVKPVDDSEGERGRSRERDQTEREAESIYEETEHFTDPIEIGAVGAAVAAVNAEEKRRFKKRSREDRDDKRNADGSSQGEDPIQAEADRIYREAVLARKIAASKTEDDPVVRVVTPPAMAHKKKASPYDAPNADFSLDKVMDPVEFMTSPIKGPGTYPSEFAFDENSLSDLKRPLLTLIRPTPTPSPAPENRKPMSQSRESSRDVEASESKKETKQTQEKKQDEKKDEPTEAPRDARTAVTEAQPAVVQTPTSASGTRNVTWGENETKHYEVETPYDNRDDPMARSMKSSEPQEKPKMSPAKKASAWGAVKGAFISGAAAAAVAKATEATKPEKSDRQEEPKNASAAPFEYRGVVVEPASSSRDSEERGPPAVGPKPSQTPSSKPQASQMPGAFEDDIDFTATVAAGLEHSGFDPEIVIKDPSYRRRSSPPGSNDDSPLKNYKQPFAETVSDLSQVLAESPRERKIRDIGREDDYDSPSRSNKKEQKRRDREAKRQSNEISGVDLYREPPTSSQLVEEPENYSEPSKSDKRDKKAKKSKRDSNGYDDEANGRSEKRISVPIDAFDDMHSEVSALPVEEDEWATSKKSKKKSKRDSDRYDSPARSMSASEVNSSAEQTSSKKSKDRSKRDSDGADSPSVSRGASEFTSTGDQTSSKKSKRRSGQYDIDPYPEDVPLPAPTMSEVGKDDDYEYRKSKKSSKRDSSSFSDVADTRSVVSEPARDEEYESRKAKKSSKRDSSSFSDVADARSVASEPAKDDDYESRKSKKSSKRDSSSFSDVADNRSAKSASASKYDDDKSNKKEKKSGGFFGLFGSSKPDVKSDSKPDSKSDTRSEPDRSRDTEDDTDARKKSKKSHKRRSTGDDSELYRSDSKKSSNGHHYDKYDVDDGDPKRSTNGNAKNERSDEKEESFLDNAGTLGAGVGIVAAAAIAAQHLQSKAAQADKEDRASERSANEYVSKPKASILHRSEDLQRHELERERVSEDEDPRHISQPGGHSLPDSRSLREDEVTEEEIPGISLRDISKPEERSIEEPRALPEEEIVDPEIAEREVRVAIDPYFGDFLPLPPSNPGSPNEEPTFPLPALPESRPGTPPKNDAYPARDRSSGSARRIDHPTPAKTPSRSAVPIQYILGNRSTPSSPGGLIRGPSAVDSTMKSPEALMQPLKARPRPTSWDSTKGLRTLSLLDPNRQEISSPVSDTQRQYLTDEDLSSAGELESSTSTREIPAEEALHDTYSIMQKPVSTSSDAVVHKHESLYEASAAESTDIASLPPLPDTRPVTPVNDEPSITHSPESQASTSLERSDFSELPPLPDSRRSTPFQNEVHRDSTHLAGVLATGAALGLSAAAVAALSSHEEEDKVPEMSSKSAPAEELPAEFQVEPITKDRSSYLFQATPPTKRFEEVGIESPLARKQRSPDAASPRLARTTEDDDVLVQEPNSPQAVAHEREATLDALSRPDTDEDEPMAFATPPESVKALEPEVHDADKSPSKKSKKGTKDKKKRSKEVYADDESFAEAVEAPLIDTPREEIAAEEFSTKKKSKKDNKEGEGPAFAEEEEEPSFETILLADVEPIEEFSVKKSKKDKKKQESSAFTKDEPSIEPIPLREAEPMEEFSVKKSKKDKKMGKNQAKYEYETEDKPSSAMTMSPSIAEATREADEVDDFPSGLRDIVLPLPLEPTELVNNSEEFSTKKSKKDRKKDKKKGLGSFEALEESTPIMPTAVEGDTRDLAPSFEETVLSRSAEDKMKEDATTNEDFSVAKPFRDEDLQLSDDLVQPCDENLKRLPAEGAPENDSFENEYSSKKSKKGKKRDKKKALEQFEAEDELLPASVLPPVVTSIAQEADASDGFSSTTSKRDKKKDKRKGKSLSRTSTMELTTPVEPSPSLGAKDEVLLRAQEAPLPVSRALSEAEFGQEVNHSDTRDEGMSALAVLIPAAATIAAQQAYTSDEPTVSLSKKSKKKDKKNHKNLSQSWTLEETTVPEASKDIESPGDDLSGSAEAPLPISQGPLERGVVAETSHLVRSEKEDLSRAADIPLPISFGAEDLDTEAKEGPSQAAQTHLPATSEAHDLKTKVIHEVSRAAETPLPGVSGDDDLTTEPLDELSKAAAIPLPVESENGDLESRALDESPRAVTKSLPVTSKAKDVDDTKPIRDASEAAKVPLALASGDDEFKLTTRDEPSLAPPGHSVVASTTDDLDRSRSDYLSLAAQTPLPATSEAGEFDDHSRDVIEGEDDSKDTVERASTPFPVKESGKGKKRGRKSVQAWDMDEPSLSEPAIGEPVSDQCAEQETEIERETVGAELAKDQFAERELQDHDVQSKDPQAAEEGSSREPALEFLPAKESKKGKNNGKSMQVWEAEESAVPEPVEGYPIEGAVPDEDDDKFQPIMHGYEFYDTKVSKKGKKNMDRTIKVRESEEPATKGVEDNVGENPIIAEPEILTDPLDEATDTRDILSAEKHIDASNFEPVFEPYSSKESKKSMERKDKSTPLWESEETTTIAPTEAELPVELVTKDILAEDFTEQNAEANEVPGIKDTLDKENDEIALVGGDPFEGLGVKGSRKGKKRKDKSAPAGELEDPAMSEPVIEPIEKSVTTEVLPDDATHQADEIREFEDPQDNIATGTQDAAEPIETLPKTIEPTGSKKSKKKKAKSAKNRESEDTPEFEQNEEESTIEPKEGPTLNKREYTAQGNDMTQPSEPVFESFDVKEMKKNKKKKGKSKVTGNEDEAAGRLRSADTVYEPPTAVPSEREDLSGFSTPTSKGKGKKKQKQKPVGWDVEEPGQGPSLETSQTLPPLPLSDDSLETGKAVEETHEVSRDVPAEPIVLAGDTGSYELPHEVRQSKPPERNEVSAALPVPTEHKVSSKPVDSDDFFAARSDVSSADYFPSAASLHSPWTNKDLDNEKSYFPSAVRLLPAVAAGAAIAAEFASHKADRSSNSASENTAPHASTSHETTEGLQHTSSARASETEPSTKEPDILTRGTNDADAKPSPNVAVIPEADVHLDAPKVSRNDRPLSPTWHWPVMTADKEETGTSEDSVPSNTALAPLAAQSTAVITEKEFEPFSKEVQPPCESRDLHPSPADQKPLDLEGEVIEQPSTAETEADRAEVEHVDANPSPLYSEEQLEAAREMNAEFGLGRKKSKNKKGRAPTQDDDLPIQLPEEQNEPEILSRGAGDNETPSEPRTADGSAVGFKEDQLSLAKQLQAEFEAGGKKSKKNKKGRAGLSQTSTQDDDFPTQSLDEQKDAEVFRRDTEQNRGVDSVPEAQTPDGLAAGYKEDQLSLAKQLQAKFEAGAKKSKKGKKSRSTSRTPNQEFEPTSPYFEEPKTLEDEENQPASRAFLPIDEETQRTQSPDGFAAGFNPEQLELARQMREEFSSGSKKSKKDKKRQSLIRSTTEDNFSAADGGSEDAGFATTDVDSAADSPHPLSQVVTSDDFDSFSTKNGKKSKKRQSLLRSATQDSNRLAEPTRDSSMEPGTREIKPSENDFEEIAEPPFVDPFAEPEKQRSTIITEEPESFGFSTKKGKKGSKKRQNIFKSETQDSEGSAAPAGGVSEDPETRQLEPSSTAATEDKLASSQQDHFESIPPTTKKGKKAKKQQTLVQSVTQDEEPSATSTAAFAENGPVEKAREIYRIQPSATEADLELPNSDGNYASTINDEPENFSSTSRKGGKGNKRRQNLGMSVNQDEEPSASRNMEVTESEVVRDNPIAKDRGHDTVAVPESAQSSLEEKQLAPSDDFEAFTFTTKKDKKGKKKQRSGFSTPAREEEPFPTQISTATDPEVEQERGTGIDVDIAANTSADPDVAALEAELNSSSKKSKKDKGKKSKANSGTVTPQANKDIKVYQDQGEETKLGDGSLADRIWAEVMPAHSTHPGDTNRFPEGFQDPVELYARENVDYGHKLTDQHVSSRDAPSWADEVAEESTAVSRDGHAVAPRDSNDRPAERHGITHPELIQAYEDARDPAQHHFAIENSTLREGLPHEHVMQNSPPQGPSKVVLYDSASSSHERSISAEHESAQIGNDDHPMGKVASAGLAVAGAAVLAGVLTGHDRGTEEVSQEDEPAEPKKKMARGQAKLMDHRSAPEDEFLDDPKLWGGAETQKFSDHDDRNDMGDGGDFWSVPRADRSAEEEIEIVGPVESHKRDRTDSMDVWQPGIVMEHAKTSHKHHHDDVPAAIERDVNLEQESMEEEAQQEKEPGPDISEDFVRKSSKKSKKNKKQGGDTGWDALNEPDEDITRDLGPTITVEAAPEQAHEAIAAEIRAVAKDNIDNERRGEEKIAAQTIIPTGINEGNTKYRGLDDASHTGSGPSKDSARQKHRGEEVCIPPPTSSHVITEEEGTRGRGLVEHEIDSEREASGDSIRKKHRGQELHLPPQSSLPPVLEEDSFEHHEIVKAARNPEQAARERGIGDYNRDSALVTESPVPLQRRFGDDHEHTRDSGVHLGETPLSKARSPIASTDDALARMSWPAVDEDSETVGLHRSQRVDPEKGPRSRGSAVAAVALGTIGAAELTSHANRASRRSNDAHFEPTKSDRSNSPNISHLQTPDQSKFRPSSAGSNRSSNLSSGTPPLRRSDRKLSGDLRSLSQRSEANLAKQAKDAKEAERSPATSIVSSNPVANEGRVRVKDMADVYDGFGEGRIGSPMSPTRPHSMRRRQSMQVLDLEARVEQLAAENRMLAEAKNHAEHSLHAAQRATLALADRDAEVDTLKQQLEWLHREVERLKEINDGLTSANIALGNQHNERYGALEAQHAQSTRELDEIREAHGSLSTGMEAIITEQVAAATQERDREIAQLRQDLETAQERIRELQKEILASKTPDSDFLVFRDEDYFDNACQQLCQHVQQWVLRFSKFSDMRACRLTSEINNDKIIDRLDNAILDGSDVDEYLKDRVKRRDVFMSMTMTMIWEFVFTRYLFGMDREQRQKLKTLEKTLTEVGPPAAVHRWRATTLTLLSKRNAFIQQREQDTEAVVQVIFQTLSDILPPPTQLENQIQEQLKRVMRAAIDLSIEMRTQCAEYMMLPPLRPEYDANGDLAREVQFNAALMNERSGDTVSNEDLEAQGAVVRIVLFPLVVKKGDDSGDGDDEIVVCPAQVLVAKPKRQSRHVTPEVMGQNANHSRMSLQSSAPVENVPDI